jgi:transcriptional regulator with XRE-family HTH domain
MNGLTNPYRDAIMKRLRVTISKGLAKARRERGLSQSELAQLTGLLPSAVAHFEAGRRMPTVHNLARLADALGISLDALFGRVAPDSIRTPTTHTERRTPARKRRATARKT